VTEIILDKALVETWLASEYPQDWLHFTKYVGVKRVRLCNRPASRMRE
jgi:hypothetical protein